MVERHANVPEDRRVRLRIGVNLDEVVVDGDDIHGDGVNIAARLEAEAAPDGVCVSDDVMRQVRCRLDLDFVDGGERELKNIAYPHSFFDGFVALFAPRTGMTKIIFWSRRSSWECRLYLD